MKAPPQGSGEAEKQLFESVEQRLSIISFSRSVNFLDFPCLRWSGKTLAMSRPGSLPAWLLGASHE